MATLIASLWGFSDLAQATTVQDTYADATKIASQPGSEVEGGNLINLNEDLGTVLDFDGTDDYITMGTGLTQITGEMTVMAWVNPDVRDVNNIVASQHSGGGAYNFYLIANNAAGQAGVVWGAYSILSISLLETGKWTHVAAVRAGSAGAWTSRVYINGALNNWGSTATNPNGAAGSETFIGAFSAASNRFNGKVADVRLFTSALTQEQISQIAQGYQNVGSPYGWWKLNDGAGTNADDSGSGGNDGTLSSGPTWTTNHAPFYAQRGSTTSTDLVTGLGAATINSIAYTTSKKSGGTSARLQFSKDVNANRANVATFTAASSTYVSIPDDSALEPADAFTIEAWIKPTTVASNYGVFGKYDAAGDWVSYNLVTTSTGGFNLYVQNKALNQFPSWASPVSLLTAGKWNHIAVTYTRTAFNSTDGKMYINGVSVTPTFVANNYTGTFALEYSSGTASIGRWEKDTPDSYFDGNVAEVVFYSDVRTATEIMNDYLGVDPDITDANLISHWKIDEGSGTAIDNAEGTATIDGTLTNGAWATDAGSPTLKSLSEAFYNSSGDIIRGVGGYFFDGINDQVATGKTIANLITNSTGTISAWIRPAYLGGTAAASYSLPGVVSDSGGYIGIHIGIRTGGVSGVYAYNWDGNEDQCGGAIQSGVWSHVVWQHTGGNIYLYVNGIQACTAASGNTSVTTGTISLGRNYNATTWYPGDMDDVRFYNVALSASEIWNLYSKSTDAHTSSAERKAWYRMDGSLSDSSGNGFTATTSTATSTGDFTSASPVGDATLDENDTMYFDGVNDYIEVADSDVFSFGNGSTDTAASFGAWVYPLATGVQVIMGKLTLAAPEWLFYTNTTNTLRLILYDSSAGAYIGRETTTILPLAKWSYVSATYDGNELVGGIKLYINGVRADTTNVTTGVYVAMENLATAVRFGTDSGTANDYKGYIANPTVWNDERTAAEVLADFQNGYIDTSNANLVDFWGIKEGTGTSIGSYTATHDGTSSGATWVTTITRPAPAAPTQQTLSLATIAFTNSIYSRIYQQATDGDTQLAYALNEITLDYTPGAAPTQIKSVNGVSLANVKKINGVPIANVKKVNGVNNS